MPDAVERGHRDEQLERVTAALRDASDLDDIQRIISTGARDLTGADGAAFVLRDGDHCCYLDEDAIAPLWKGRRFPMETCISGWVMQEQQVAVVPDVLDDDRIPHEIYRPTFVRSAAVVPIRTSSPVGAIAVYWSRLHEADDGEVDALRTLADRAADALAVV